jgi:hypothetical protein
MRNTQTLDQYLRSMDVSATDRVDGVTLLLGREQSTMVSTWIEILALLKTSTGKWKLSTGGLEWVANIHDIVPTDDLYDEIGNLNIPEVHEGQRVVGVDDGEYLVADRFVGNDFSNEFDEENLLVAKSYCQTERWSECEGFDSAWGVVVARVRIS